MINVRKRGNYYQYSFEAARVGGKRKQITKSGFNTKAEAEKTGVIAYNEYMQTGRSFKPEDISYSDYLDYWMKEYCEVNLKYHTIEVYKRIIRIHIKPFIGHYLLPQITTAILEEFINERYLQGSYTRNYLHNMLKVVKGSFTYACDGVGFIKEKLQIKGYIRYMDDFILIHKDKNYLRYCLKEIDRFCKERLKVELNSKTQIGKVKNGIDFFGFRLILIETGKVIKKLRGSSKRRIKKHLRNLKKLEDKGIVDREYVNIRKNCFYSRINNSDESRTFLNKAKPDY